MGFPINREKLSLKLGLGVSGDKLRDSLVANVKFIQTEYLTSLFLPLNIANWSTYSLVLVPNHCLF